MPQVQVIQPIQQQPKRLRVAAYARVSSKSANQLNSMSVQVEYYTDLIQKIRIGNLLVCMPMKVSPAPALKIVPGSTTLWTTADLV